MSVLNLRAVVAGEAVAGGLVPGAAEVADGNADIVLVEEPSLGAGLADSVVPPGTTDVGGGGVVDAGAGTIDY